MKLLQHVLCVPFPAKEKTTHCWCEFTAGGATGDAQLLFSVVPFPFERWDSSSWSVSSLLGCWELLDVILGWCGTEGDFSIPTTLAWEQEKGTLSGLQEMQWLLSCVGLTMILPKPWRTEIPVWLPLCSSWEVFPKSEPRFIRCDHVSAPRAFVHCCSWGRCWGSGKFPADKVSKGWREKSVANFFPLPNVSCQSFPAG